MSRSWHPRSFSVTLHQVPPHETTEVHGLVDNLGLFGMHFVDKLHSYVVITELKSGCRVHPEPGFPDLALAARFAEAVAHLDFSRPKKMADADKRFIAETYNSLIIGARLRESVRG